MSELLKEVYSPEQFRKQGHQLIDLLADHLSKSQKGDGKVTSYVNPREELDHWHHASKETDFSPMVKDMIERSIKLHHPKYMGHQVSAPAPVTALMSVVSSLLNNGSGIYEMGQVGCALEKLVCQKICKQIGYGAESDGILTSGGTLANLTAMLTARAVKVKEDVWEQGIKQEIGVMVSEQAHYCVDKALRVMGLGAAGAIKVPVDDHFRMRVDLLDQILAENKAKGIHVIAIVGSAPNTAAGKYDDLRAIAQFCSDNDLWFHVDGAHGGAACFSDKYKYLINGMELADSVVIDAHKMMMIPGINTFLLYKNAKDAYQTFHQKAQYLWEDQEQEEWYNYAKRTYECTKKMMSIQIYALMHQYGTKVFDENFTTLYDLGATFATMVMQHPSFELCVPPDSNIVCFRLRPDGVGENELGQLNRAIRAKLLEKGDFYIVQTVLNGKVWLRTTFMNPFTQVSDLESLLKEIEKIYKKIS